MKDVMLDFETMGNGKNAAVVQIGACYFDRVTGEIGKTFECNIDLESCIKSGGELDASTVQWWLSQSPEAIQSILANPKYTIQDSFNGLNDFLGDCKAIWSHATFDFVILQETLKRLGIKPKFRYSHARDIRTLVDIANIKTKPLVREGLHHNGLADCKHQVKYVTAALNYLKGALNEYPSQVP